MILARHDHERFAVEVLIRRLETFCYAAHIFASDRFCGTRAARLGPLTTELSLDNTTDRSRISIYY
jgi:hypothetical protein